MAFRPELRRGKLGSADPFAVFHRRCVAAKLFFAPSELRRSGEEPPHENGAAKQNGAWLSLVERLVRDQEALGSNPSAPIFFIPKTRRDNSMDIPTETELLKDPQKVFEVCDKGLVILATRTGMNGDILRPLARAEQIRRQSQAIRAFNRSSTRLAIVMILLSIGMIIIGAPQFIEALVKWFSK